MAEPAAKEPTMEEILASIRRIISEDGEPEAASAASDGLDNLTSFDDDDDSGEDFPTDDLLEADSDESDGHLLSVDDLLGNDVDFSEIDELSDLEIETAGETDTASDELDDLNDFEETLETSFEAPVEPQPTPISPELAETMEAVMATPTPQAAPANDMETQSFSATPSTGTNAALEGLVRELMAPMIKQWIDQNLPKLVEKRVEQEIQQIATKVVAALRD